MRAKRLTGKGETTHLEGQIDPGRIGSKGETTRGEGVKRAKRPDADHRSSTCSLNIHFFMKMKCLAV